MVGKREVRESGEDKLDTYETEKICLQVGKREASKSGEDKSDTYETEKIRPLVRKPTNDRRT